MIQQSSETCPNHKKVGQFSSRLQDNQIYYLRWFSLKKWTFLIFMKMYSKSKNKTVFLKNVLTVFMKKICFFRILNFYKNSPCKVLSNFSQNFPAISMKMKKKNWTGFLHISWNIQYLFHFHNHCKISNLRKYFLINSVPFSENTPARFPMNSHSKNIFPPQRVVTYIGNITSYSCAVNGELFRNCW